jgi:hypothetical protein
VPIVQSWRSLRGTSRNVGMRHPGVAMEPDTVDVTTLRSSAWFMPPPFSNSSLPILPAGVGGLRCPSPYKKGFFFPEPGGCGRCSAPRLGAARRCAFFSERFSQLRDAYYLWLYGFLLYVWCGVSAALWCGVSADRGGDECGVSAVTNFNRINLSVVFQRVILGWCGVSAWKTLPIHRVYSQGGRLMP